MKCTYINLDHASSRKKRLEDNFSAHGRSNWHLERFAAIDTRFVEQRAIEGKLRPGEKACFLSHMSVIERNIGATEPFFVLEDDVVFGRSTCTTLERFLAVSDSDEWDLLFTDLCIPQIPKMMELIKLRRELSAVHQVKLLDLSTFVFAGATAYVVNPKSVNKILGWMRAQNELNLPYDLFLRKLLFEKKLKGFVIFPFVTSISSEAEESQIQVETSADQVWNAFRRLMWVDRDLSDIVPDIKKIDAGYCDEESRLFGTLFAAQTSSVFQSK